MYKLVFKSVVEILESLNKTISTMESCTGGGIVNAITNVEGASKVFKFSAITYSNEFKIKMGVDKNIIDKYSVYSEEIAIEMSKNISDFTDSNYGIGVTGKLNRIDNNNSYGENNKVYISIYDRDNNYFYNYSMKVVKCGREKNKEEVLEFIEEKLLQILG